MNRTLLMAMSLSCAAVMAANGLSAGPAVAPAAPTSARASKPTERPKYRPVTSQQAQANHARLIASFERIKKEITPDFHSFETPHFWVYSGWDDSTDKEFGDVLEKLYGALCRQFDIPERDNIWAGKCGIFFFKDPDHFKKFAGYADKPDLEKSAGYYCHEGRSALAYIVLAPTGRKEAFYEVLAHEGTHAFLSRFLNDRRLTLWVEEGMAEFTAALLVKNSGASRKLQSALGEARKGKDPSPVFETVGLERFDYGVAQGFVAFLIARDVSAFRKFVIDMKEGKSEADALKDSYGWTREDMLKAWKAAIGAKR
ncbi:MAG: hypothetical protein ACE15C_03305 [Phycisphaerae bacterium]